MLKNAENIALQNLPFLYTFVLQAEICTTLTPKVLLFFDMLFSAVVMDFVFHVLIKI